MKKIFGIIVAAGVAAVAGGASATTYNYNFAAAIDSGTLGESIWNSYTTSAADGFAGPSLTLTGWNHDTSTGADTQVYAYADSGNAGFGVCRNPTSTAIIDHKYPGSGTNRCLDSSDDSIQMGSGWYEYLKILFNDAAQMGTVTVNANHDTHLVVGDTIGFYDSTSGVWMDHIIAAGELVNGYFTYDFGKIFAAGDYIEVRTGGKMIYVNAMSMSTVPLPAGAVLLVSGLAGLGIARRRRKA